MKRHVIYIPGLGDGYDLFRRVALYFWRRPSVAVTLVPMHWRDPHETYEEKVARIGKAIDRYEDREIILIGESAGGAVAIASLHHFRGKITRLVTICGMNQGTGNVNPSLYRRNRAFRDAMLASDRTLPVLTPPEKAMMQIIYSSRDGVVGEKDTCIEGVRAIDIKIPMHMIAIGYTLLFGRQLVIGDEKR